ncbi:Protein MICROTUBULE BINDING PROTEIN 2C [Camellia lanceoleosa]|uniref:Protein MICROTUBULE BINDING PROTEIN 2C n=1 Tax=Camellia lanceoleosa TaxID=1840588 RepID=A0ACC0FF44_9ERIC|nr:Protein MICROTUBULE BINDING PROTEIN 2C [Camellia lanceoleosa]
MVDYVSIVFWNLLLLGLPGSGDFGSSCRVLLGISLWCSEYLFVPYFVAVLQPTSIGSSWFSVDAILLLSMFWLLLYFVEAADLLLMEAADLFVLLLLMLCCKELIKLADKQAALEKLQWEAMTSNKKVEKLQEDLGSMQGEISSFLSLFECLTKNHPTMSAEDYDVTPYHLNHLPHTDDWDETEMQKI